MNDNIFEIHPNTLKTLKNLPPILVVPKALEQTPVPVPEWIPHYGLTDIQGKN
jgi:hypothetical protein